MLLTIYRACDADFLFIHSYLYSKLGIRYCQIPNHLTFQGGNLWKLVLIESAKYIDHDDHDSALIHLSSIHVISKSMIPKTCTSKYRVHAFYTKNQNKKVLWYPFLISLTVSAKWAAPPSGRSIKLLYEDYLQYYMSKSISITYTYHSITQLLKTFKLNLCTLFSISYYHQILSNVQKKC